MKLASVAEGERGGGGLIEDALDMEPREPSRLTHCLTLSVAVVGRHRDDRARDFMPKVNLGQLADFSEQEGADLLQRVDPVSESDRGLAVFAFRNFVGEVILHLLHDWRIE